MGEPVERHGRISITRRTPDGAVIHTDVRITTVDVNADACDGSGVSAQWVPMDSGECFDPESCCDAREKAMIRALRAYLRPQEAPECLLTRLRDTLDRCCGENQCDGDIETAAGCPCGNPRCDGSCSRSCCS